MRHRAAGGTLVDATTLAQMTNVGPNDYGLAIYGQGFDGHWCTA